MALNIPQSSKERIAPEAFLKSFFSKKITNTFHEYLQTLNESETSIPPPTHRLKQSIKSAWLSTTEAFDRDDGSSMI